MRYRSLRACVLDLEKHGQLIRVKEEVDPYLEMAEIQRRAYQAEGPAIFFENVKGSSFPAVCNLFGTMERTRFIFRSTLKQVQAAVQLKADPAKVLQNPGHLFRLPAAGLHALPLKKIGPAPVMRHQTQIDQLPLIHSWPMDGGPYVLLPQVCTEDPTRPGAMRTNVGMYRVQLMGNDYKPNQEIGLHYQIHRGIGVHHSLAAQQGEKLKVSVFVGGPPAHTFAAVMPLPEGLSELMFAGMFAGRNFRYVRDDRGHFINADADFVITGTIDPSATKPEGPFGDHLGYYSLQHEFPVMQVDRVYHRPGAIWPFTAVGRPPQEDTSFGKLIHAVTGPMVPVSVPGLHAMHAVDAAGVHPLLLAIGSERYVPYRKRYPQELLTVANAVLGFGQASLAKYLLIIAKEDAPKLDIHDIGAFFQHLLERIDLRRDLHFQTRTTMDTLDYSGTGLNQGSKVVMAAAGEPIRSLAKELPAELSLPTGFTEPKVAGAGILAIQGPPYHDQVSGEQQAQKLAQGLESSADDLTGFPLILLVDDSDFTAKNLNNFLWVTFTRSNPSHDIYGIKSFTDHKHWGCEGSLIIDARIKPHHAPPLVEDPEVTRRVDALGVKGGPLEGVV